MRGRSRFAAAWFCQQRRAGDFGGLRRFELLRGARMGARRIGGLVYVAVQWSGCAHALVGAIATAVVLVDGNRTPELSCPSDYLIKGDSKFDAIKAASIIAKEYHD